MLRIARFAFMERQYKGLVTKSGVCTTLRYFFVSERISAMAMLQQLPSAFPSFLDSDVLRWSEVLLNKVNDLGPRKPPSMRRIAF